MESPRVTSAGPVNARAWNSLAGDDLLSTETGPATQRLYRLALRLDREADAVRFERSRLNHEWLSPPPLELREMPA